MRREVIIEAFKKYVSGYDLGNPMIIDKMDHTFKVTDNCERIAESIGLLKEQVNIAWLTGLLHDFGRFEQVRRYGTFSDLESCDHAELGADILFKDGLIKTFLSDEELNKWGKLLETAIRQHNKLALPDDLDQGTKLYCELIRDADKTDIFRCISNLAPSRYVGNGTVKNSHNGIASNEVMDCVYGHRCVPNALITNLFELRVAHCCYAFGLCFDETFRMVKDQGYLFSLTSERDAEGNMIWNEMQTKQLRAVRAALEDFWERRL